MLNPSPEWDLIRVMLNCFPIFRVLALTNAVAVPDPPLSSFLDPLDPGDGTETFLVEVTVAILAAGLKLVFWCPRSMMVWLTWWLRWSLTADAAVMWIGDRWLLILPFANGLIVELGLFWNKGDGDGLGHTIVADDSGGLVDSCLKLDWLLLITPPLVPRSGVVTEAGVVDWLLVTGPTVPAVVVDWMDDDERRSGSWLKFGTFFPFVMISLSWPGPFPAELDLLESFSCPPPWSVPWRGVLWSWEGGCDPRIILRVISCWSFNTDLNIFWAETKSTWSKLCPLISMMRSFGLILPSWSILPLGSITSMRRPFSSPSTSTSGSLNGTTWIPSGPFPGLMVMVDTAALSSSSSSLLKLLMLSLALDIVVTLLLLMLLECWLSLACCWITTVDVVCCCIFFSFISALLALSTVGGGVRPATAVAPSPLVLGRLSSEALLLLLLQQL